VDPGGFEGPTSNESLILQCMTRQRHHESSSLLIASQKSFPEIKYQCRYRPAMKLFARYVAMRGERYRFQHFANRTRSRQQLCTALVCEGSLVTNRVGVAPRYVQLYLSCSRISCLPPPCSCFSVYPPLLLHEATTSNMLLAATAAIALGRKLSDENRKKKEAKQGLMRVGHSDVAKQAFANHQTTKALQDGKTGVQQSPTDIKYEDPDSFDVARPAVSSSSETTAQSGGPDNPAGSTPLTDTASPLRSEGVPVISTANTSKDEPHDVRSRSTSALSTGPPPYSPRRDVLVETPPSIYSQDSDRVTIATSNSSTSTSDDGNAIKIRTKGSDIKSGFAYHPALFDLNVRPELWDRFTHQVVETTKFSAGDHAKIWAAATATACTGAIITSTFVGR